MERWHLCGVEPRNSVFYFFIFVIFFLNQMGFSLTNPPIGMKMQPFLFPSVLLPVRRISCCVQRMTSGPQIADQLENDASVPIRIGCWWRDNLCFLVHSFDECINQWIFVSSCNVFHPLLVRLCKEAYPHPLGCSQNRQEKLRREAGKRENVITQEDAQNHAPLTEFCENLKFWKWTLLERWESSETNVIIPSWQLIYNNMWLDVNL